LYDEFTDLAKIVYLNIVAVVLYATVPGCGVPCTVTAVVEGS
jgi:hypothetical protein